MYEYVCVWGEGRCVSEYVRKQKREGIRERARKRKKGRNEGSRESDFRKEGIMKNILIAGRMPV